MRNNRHDDSARPTVAGLLRSGVRRLDHLPAPRLEAECLLAAATSQRRSWLHAWPDAPVSAADTHRYFAWVARRASGIPLSYLTGRREFWSLELEVTPATLVPRAETEELVAVALEVVHPGQTLLDLGTGSGAIALALASERPDINVVATDTSCAALKVASRNARRLGLPVSFVRTRWLTGIGNCCVDVIASNPPYVAAGDPHLRGDGVRVEPKSALVSGQQGLQDITAIATTAPRCLRAGGWLLLEHGHQQGDAVRDLLRAQRYSDIATRTDAGGQQRVTMARYAD